MCLSLSQYPVMEGNVEVGEASRRPVRVAEGDNQRASGLNRTWSLSKDHQLR